MATLTLSVAEEIKDYVEAYVGDEFADGGAYVTQLILEDRERQMAALRGKIDASRAGGISDRTTADIFAEAVARTKARGTYRE